MKMREAAPEPSRPDAPAGCPYCAAPGGALVWQDDRCRVVLVVAEPFAGFCRVVWNRHVREMTDLEPGDRAHLMRAVFATEAALRSLLAPDKMNLASLGNAVPHVHWHVIPRFADDSHFPQSVWSARQREAAARTLPADFERALRARLADELGTPS
jgi:diadenosine tetraphosphate (Ap4A) HIT family hydrolase